MFTFKVQLAFSVLSFPLKALPLLDSYATSGAVEPLSFHLPRDYGQSPHCI